MIESLLFKSVEMVYQGQLICGDVFVKNGRIEAIGPSLTVSAEQEICEKGLSLIPGAIDSHVHFREPGLMQKEDFFTGTRAAAAGGVTTVLDMPNTQPPTITNVLLEQKRALVRDRAVVNYGFFLGATADNFDEIQHVENIAGIKLFLGSSTGGLLVARRSDIERLFQETRHLIAVHAEDEAEIVKNRQKYPHPTILEHMKIRSEDGVIKAVEFVVSLAQEYHKRLHLCHVSTRQEVELLKNLSDRSLISAEVSPHHLFFSALDVYKRFGTLAQVNPPIREAQHTAALWEGLKSGAIDMIATDHAPHLMAEKQQPFGQAPSGVPGVETVLPVMLNAVHKKQCQLTDVVRWLCEQPAARFKMAHKGKLAVGYDADLVLIDRKHGRAVSNKGLYTRCQWSLFDGQLFTGWPVATFVRGQCVFREGDFSRVCFGEEVRFEAR